MKLSKSTGIKLGEFLNDVRVQFRVCCTTHQKSLIEVYQRVYVFSLDDKRTTDTKMVFGLTSEDICPSGWTASGTNRRFGNFELEFDEKDLNSDTKKILMNVLKDIDSSFWWKYKDKLTKDNVLVCPMSGPNF